MSVVGMKLIFQGIYKSSIDVIIVEHVDQNVTELIMYDPSHCKEAPRMYFNSTVLDFQLNHEAIEHQLSFAKQNKVVITAKLVDGIVNEAKSNYILDRIVVTKRWEESKGLDFNFQPNNEDRSPVGLICERPKAAQPYRTVFYQNFVSGMDDNNVVDGLPVISLWSKSRAADNSEDNADNMSEGSHGITPVPTPRGMRQKPVSSHSASTSPVPHNKKQVHPAAESAQEIDPNLQLDSKLQNGNTLLLRLNRYLSGTSHVPVRAAAVTLRHHEVDTGGARISGTLQRLMIGLGTILVPAVARKQSGETSNITVDASFTPPSAATEELPAPRHCVLAHETADTSPGCDSTTPPLANDKAETVETAKNNHSADSNVHSYISGWLEHRTHNKVYVADK